MKVSKLIELLKELPPNTEVLLWNGMVGDWMDISSECVEGDLVKQTFTDYAECIRLEKCVDLKNWDIQLDVEELASIRKSYNRYVKWEVNQFITHKDVNAGRYSIKNVVYLQGKTRGITAFDRLGSISY